MDNSPILTVDKAAELIGVQPHTLKRWRVRGRGPRYLKLPGKVRYRAADIEDFINSAVVDPAAGAVKRNRDRRRRRAA